jgi:hypothetical protein
MVHIWRPANESGHGGNLGILVVEGKIREVLEDGLVLVQGKDEETTVDLLGFWVCLYDELGDGCKRRPLTH